MSHREDSAGLLAHFTRLHPKVIDLSLGRMRRLLGDLHHPERALPPVIHVAGTNGKGSTVAFLRALAKAGGLSAHAGISPHLVSFHERIVLNDTPISEPDLVALLREVADANANREITFFEITQAAAFLAFSRRPADLLFLETGLGGRFDASNVIDRPAVTAITPIGLDHQAFLGDTLEKIAFEKAGIMKPGVPCVVAPQEKAAMEVLDIRAKQLDVPLCKVAPVTDERTLGLCGAHQRINAAVALAALNAVPGITLSDRQLARGLAQAHWPARLHRLSHGPLVGQLAPDSELWLDGAHNPAAAVVLADALRAFADSRPVYLVLGMLDNRDPGAFLRPLSPHITEFRGVAIPGHENSFSGDRLAEAARAAGMRATVPANLEQAVTAPAGARVFIVGSLYLAGEVLKNHG